MSKPSLTALSIMIGALATAGCSNNPYPQQATLPAQTSTIESRQQLQVSESEAVIIRQLPPDADIESMDEQRRLVPQRLYLTWDGHRRELDAKPAAQASTAQQTGHVDDQAKHVRKRASGSQDSIILDKLPPPIVIE